MGVWHECAAVDSEVLVEVDAGAEREAVKRASRSNVDTLYDAIELVNMSNYGNGTSIFTESVAALRRYRQEVEVGMIVLALAPEGWPQAQLLWVLPGLKSINPHCQAEHPCPEYAHIDFKESEPLRWRAGFFLDRLPGPTSVHGTDPGKSRLHGVCLDVRDGKPTAPGGTG